MAQVTEAPSEQADLLPAPAINLRRAANLGLLSGVTMVLVAAIGMVESFDGRILIDPFLSLGNVLLFAMPFLFAWTASRPAPRLEGVAPEVVGSRNLTAGLVVGALGGLVLGLFLLLASVVNLRAVLVGVSPKLLQILTFGASPSIGALILVGMSAILGLVAASSHLVSSRLRRSIFESVGWVLLWGLLEDVFQQLFTGLKIGFVNDLLYTSSGALKIAGALVVGVVFFALTWWRTGRTLTLRARYQALPRERRGRWALGGIVVIGILLAFLPPVMGPFISQVLDLAGLFLLMALGLNIVIGYAGLLDLGYVAFFAVGAYTTSILTSPNSPRFSPELAVLTALPFVLLAAATAGILVATPVLRMRGDYLAIVTLGFGEIARILLNSQWLAPTFGGAQGITNVPGLEVGPVAIRTPEGFFYPIFLLVLVAAYATYSLQNSRMGRAWMAMREDESVAEAMGVNIVTAKLSAFVVGALFASVGGALFAHRVGSVFPHSFDVVVSITVLVIIIVGGMGSVPGVALGALVLVGLPELLREFSEYRFLFYGVLLIFMMLKRPEGFIPSKQRAQELHQEEVAQDAWTEIYGAESAPDTKTPA